MSLRAIVWVLDHSEATLGARLVLLALAEYAHDDGTKAFPKVETIARKARMSRKGVQDALRRLEREGHIARTGKTKDGTNVYSIPGVEPGENSGDTGDKGGEDDGRRGVAASARGEETTPDPLKDPRKDPEVVEALSTAWGKHPGLPTHRAAYYAQPKVQTAIRNAMKTYAVEEIVEAVGNYATVLAGKSYYWNHRWTFQEFLARGLDRFVVEADPLSNFRVGRDLDGDGGLQRSPAQARSAAEAWILETAYRLPIEEWELAEELGRRGIEGPDRTKLVAMWHEKRCLAA